MKAFQINKLTFKLLILVRILIRKLTLFKYKKILMEATQNGLWIFDGKILQPYLYCGRNKFRSFEGLYTISLGYDDY